MNTEKFMEDLTTALVKTGSQSNEVQELVQQASDHSELKEFASAAVELRAAFEMEQQGELITGINANKEEPVKESADDRPRGNWFSNLRFVQTCFAGVTLLFVCTLVYQFGIKNHGTDSIANSNDSLAYSKLLPDANESEKDSDSKNDIVVAKTSNDNIAIKWDTKKLTSLYKKNGITKTFGKPIYEMAVKKDYVGVIDFPKMRLLGIDESTIHAGRRGAIIPLPIDENGELNEESWNRLFAKLSKINRLVNQKKKVGFETIANQLDEHYEEMRKVAGQRKRLVNLRSDKFEWHSNYLLLKDSKTQEKSGKSSTIKQRK